MSSIVVTLYKDGKISLLGLLNDGELILRTTKFLLVGPPGLVNFKLPLDRFEIIYRGASSIDLSFPFIFRSW